MDDLNGLPGKHVFFAKCSSDDSGAPLKSLEAAGDCEPDAPAPKKGNRFRRIVSARSYAEEKLRGLGAKRSRSRSSTSEVSKGGKKEKSKVSSSLKI